LSETKCSQSSEPWFTYSSLIQSYWRLAIDVNAPELGIDTSSYLSPWLATVVLIGYGAVFAATAWATSLKRDIE
jgi:hypothetical protein